MEFTQLYDRASDEVKLKFLDAVIRQNPDIQKQFEKYVASGSDLNRDFSFQEFCQEAESTKALYLDFFEELDTENPDFDNYISSYSGYMPEWEACQEASEQEVAAMFEHFQKKALEKIIGHQSEKLLAMLAGLLNAASEAEVEDPVETFWDFNEYLQEEFKHTLTSIVEKVRMAPWGESRIFQAWSLFFRYCDQVLPGGDDFVVFFEEMLITLAEKSHSPGALLEILQHSSVKREHLPRLTLLLMKKTGNPQGWLNVALQSYRYDQEVARQLLAYYFEHNLNGFLKVARELFDNDRRTWSRFLKDFISPEMDQSLYVDVYYKLVVDESNIDYYKKIRSFLFENEKNHLMKEVKWRKPFVARILEVEERFEDIKMLAEATSGYEDFPGVIQPILHVYPEFCFNELTRRVWQMLETSRGRSTYQTIADWLKLSQNIPGFTDEKKEIIARLYHHKPNLPALKDELRKAGVMN